MAAIFIELPPFVQDEEPQQAIKRLHSYLYQAAERMNEALTLVDQSLQETAEAAQEQLNAVTQQLGASTQRMGRAANDALLREAESLRSLIIDNADEINRVEQTIQNQLQSSYVAKSEFGEYKEQALAQMTQTADSAITEYNASETITGLQADAEAAKSFQRDYDAYIKTGLLFRDSQGNRVYGVAVGENLTRVTQIVDGVEEVVLERSGLSAVFTATKLSFYQNGTEVAYLSNHKLYITQIVVLDRFQLGDLILAVDTGGIAVTWA